MASDCDLTRMIHRAGSAKQHAGVLVAGAVVGGLGALGAILVHNARALAPTPIPNPLAPSLAKGSDESVKRFQEMLRIPTVWGRENPDADHEPFDRFVPRMRELYPRTFSQLELTMINQYGILLKWEGEDSSLAPVVLMAHHDVVAADPQTWTHDPFAAEIEGGRIYARGSLDTKCLLAGLYEATETLLAEGFTPPRTVYLWSSNCEEDNGDTTPCVVKYLKDHDVNPAFVLDEGGAIIDNPPLGIDKNMAVVGVSEKGLVNIHITVRSEGGHSSTPSKDDATVRLIEGLQKLMNMQPEARLSEPVEAMLCELGSYGSFPLKLVFGNMWLFRPLVVAIMKRNPETAATVRTTYALTELKGSDAANVLPKEAHATVNIRVDPAETVAQAVARVRECFDDDVEFELFDNFEPSHISPRDQPYDYIRRVVHSVYPQAGIMPYIQSSSSDARHMSLEFEHVYRFAGILYRGSQRGTIHGQDENIDVESFKRGVGFYTQLIRNLDSFEGE